MSDAIRLEAVRLPAWPKGAVRRCLTDPTRQFFGLLSDEGLNVLSYADGLAPPVLFRLPRLPRAMHLENVQAMFAGKLIRLPVPRLAEAPPLALHPRGDRVALVTDQEINVIGPDGRERSVAQTLPDAQAAQVKGALYDCTGDVLWISREFKRSTSRVAVQEPWHEVLAFSTADCRLLGRAPVTGEMWGGHNLAAHPTQSSVGVEVSCGQDGSWITFAAVQEGQVSRLPAGVHSDSGLFNFADFAPDGGSLITVGESLVQEYAWPDGRLTAKADANSDEDEGQGDRYFGWNGAYVGQYFIGLAEGEAGDLLRAFACPGLRPVESLKVKPSTKQLNGQLYGLGSDLLITEGSGGIRAWRLTAE